MIQFRRAAKAGKKQPERVHLWLTLGWILLLIPTVLWWQESIIWLVFQSWYANFVGHWSAYEAARE